MCDANKYNFDRPDAFDLDLIIKTLRRLKEGKHADIPVYNFTTHSVENHKVLHSIGIQSDIKISLSL